MRRLSLNELENLVFDCERQECTASDARRKRRVEIPEAIVERLTANSQDIERAEIGLKNLVKIEEYLSNTVKRSSMPQTETERWISLAKRTHRTIGNLARFVKRCRCHTSVTTKSPNDVGRCRRKRCLTKSHCRCSDPDRCPSGIMPPSSLLGRPCPGGARREGGTLWRPAITKAFSMLA
jgi:hypothetical protein